MKNNYKLYRILKKITGVNTSQQSTLQKVSLSEEGRENAKRYYEKKELIKELPDSIDADKRIIEENEKYLKFQVELEARKVKTSSKVPPEPAKIPKLPIPKTWLDEEL